MNVDKKKINLNVPPSSKSNLDRLALFVESPELHQKGIMQSMPLEIIPRELFDQIIGLIDLFFLTHKRNGEEITQK